MRGEPADDLPTGKKRLPLLTLAEVPAKAIMRRGTWLEGQTPQTHMRLLRRAPSLLAVAARAGSYQVQPGMLAAQVPGHNMVEGEQGAVPATVLADVLIAPQYFALAEGDSRTRTAHHVIQSDDGGKFKFPAAAVNDAPAIEDQIRLAGDKED